MDIKPGEKLLVLGDPEQGVALVKLETLMQNTAGAAQLIQAAEAAALNADPAPEAE